jgi:alpha-beta hydrolase superfamily lysophospholipase
LKAGSQDGHAAQRKTLVIAHEKANNRGLGRNKVVDFQKNAEMMDRPEILYRLFFPRRESDLTDVPNAVTIRIEVGEDVSIGCRFYPVRTDGPNILYFHGNGETVPDYDYEAPVYGERGLNLFVADYRGYGFSDGEPSCSAMIRDSHPIFHGFTDLLAERGFAGPLFVMGRSLGSAPAVEVAYHHQGDLKGLIVESGFASGRNQFKRLGVSDLFDGVENPIGFGNDVKIREVTIPTLIIHGEHDTIIPASEGHALLTLSGATKKSSLFVARAGHNDLMVEALDAYMSALQKFVESGPG